jgi:hypothetical protein
MDVNVHLMNQERQCIIFLALCLYLCVPRFVCNCFIGDLKIGVEMFVWVRMVNINGKKTWDFH